MVRAWSYLVAMMAGCSFSLDPGAALIEDGRIDLQIVDVVTDDCSQWQAHRFDACAIPQPTGDITLDTASPLVFDTTGLTLTDNIGSMIPIVAADYPQAGGHVAAVWSIANFQLGPGITIHVVGSKPLIIAAWGALVVDGRIDASSQRGGRTGAGSNPVTCATSAATAGVDGTSGNGGGGGGGGQGSGAAGGDGDGNCGGPPGCYRIGGVGGAAISNQAIVLGGRSGARSGTSGGIAAAGGAGGGAIHVAARGAMVVTGAVLAGGAGGGGDVRTDFSYGGGGGGAGGSVGLEAATIDVRGSIIAANGGGGGGGAAVADTGGAGADGAAGSAAASGGTAPGGGTSGGQGSSLAAINGGGSNGGTVPAVPPNGGGGGGGGGAGFVQYWTTSFMSGNATISPAPSAGN